MLVALSADMEGVSQLDDWRAIFAFDPAYWREGRAQMEAEVAAAARGLLTGGADEVVVFDNQSARAMVAPGRRTSRCSGFAVTTFTLARSARSTASPTSSRNTHRRRWTPAPRRHSTRSSALPRTSRARGVPVRPPERARFEAFVRGEPLYALDIPRWQDACQPLADAMAAAVAP